MEVLDESGSIYFQIVDSLRFSCCITLRSLFQRKWEEECETTWNEDTCRDVILKRITLPDPIQQRCLKEEAFESFDISLLCQLLLEFPWKDKVKEKKAIRDLRTVRNQLAHKDEKVLSEDEFKCKLEKIKRALESLGMAKAEIEKMVQEATDKATGLGDIITNLRQLMRNGDKQMNKGECSTAIDKYTEAINLKIPTLPPGELSVLYEKRGWAYYILSKKENFGEKLQSKAKEDASEALKLNENSWRAHHIMGLVHKDNLEVNRSLKHLKMALAICPKATEVKNDIASCQFLKQKVQNESYLNPSENMTILDYVADYNKSTRQSLTAEQFFNRGRQRGKRLKNSGLDYYLQGLRFLCGYGQKQDFAKAAGFFTKAGEDGYFRGTLALAELYLKGDGVKQKLPHGAKLVNEIASKPLPKSKCDSHSAIVDAQAKMAELYRLGIGVEQNYETSVFWYEKSANNGSVCGKHNLGTMYSNGTGVPKDKEMAVRYWKMACQERCMYSAYALHKHFLNEMEPKDAREYLNESIKLGNTCLERDKDAILKRVDKVEESRRNIEEKIIKFEKENDLPIKGMTFLERKKRVERVQLMKNPEKSLSVSELHEIVKEVQPATKSMCGDLMDFYDAAFIGGSKTALDIYTWQWCCKYASEAPVTVNSPLEDKYVLMDAIYQCCTTSAARIFDFPPNIRDELITLLVKSIPESVWAEESELDKKARVCHCYLLAMKDSPDTCCDYGLEVALKRYPGEIALHRLLSCLLYADKMYDKQKALLETALKSFSNDPLLLFDYALNLSKTSPPEDVRTACFEFLKSTDDQKDHFYRPWIYYVIGETYVATSKKGKKDVVNLAMVSHYYDEGLKAEKCLHKIIAQSHHENYRFDSKKVLEAVLESEKFTIPNQPLPAEELAQVGSSSSRTHLQQPNRIATIRKFRELVKDLREKKGEFFEEGVAKGYQKLPGSLLNLKEITLRHMVIGKAYEKNLLTLTLIEEPLLHVQPVYMLGEDGNGDVCFLSIHDLGQDYKSFTIGSRLSVINPFMVGIDSGHLKSYAVRIEDGRCVIRMDEVKNMCRYCWEKGATFHCIHCSALYCSKACQEKDWKDLKHKWVCVKK